MKPTNSACISLVSLIILAILGWRGADVSMAIVGICTAYVGSRQVKKASDVWAASKDSAASTQEAINTTEGKL